MRRLPPWLGGAVPPLELRQLEAVVAQLGEFLRSLAREAFHSDQVSVQTAELSRWLGTAALRVSALAPTPRPDLLGEPLACEPPPTLDLGEGLAVLAEVLAVLGADEGWGDRNLAFLARSLAHELAWWREQREAQGA
jgi:hypothetical protein